MVRSPDTLPSYMPPPLLLIDRLPEMALPGMVVTIPERVALLGDLVATEHHLRPALCSAFGPFQCQSVPLAGHLSSSRAVADDEVPPGRHVGNHTFQ